MEMWRMRRRLLTECDVHNVRIASNLNTIPAANGINFAIEYESVCVWFAKSRWSCPGDREIGGGGGGFRIEFERAPEWSR